MDIPLLISHVSMHFNLTFPTKFIQTSKIGAICKSERRAALYLSQWCCYECALKALGLAQVLPAADFLISVENGMDTMVVRFRRYDPILSPSLPFYDNYLQSTRRNELSS